MTWTIHGILELDFMELNTISYGNVREVSWDLTINHVDVMWVLNLSGSFTTKVFHEFSGKCEES